MKNLTQIEIEGNVDVLEDVNESKKIVVYNDDYNTFEHVISCFVAYCEHSWEQAEQCAVIIHSKGKCSVKEGNYDKLKPIREALCEAGIDSKIE